MAPGPPGEQGARRYPWSDPLGRRFLLGIVLVSSLVTLITTGITLHREYQRDLDRIGDSMDLIGGSYLSSLVNALWNFDQVQTDLVLRGMASLPDMERLEVALADGGAYEIGMPRSSRTVERELDLVYTSSAGETRLGRLRAVASIDRIIDRLWDRLLVVLASNAIKTFVVAAVALWLFSSLVTRHLHRIAIHASELELDDGPPLPLSLERRSPATGSPDALARLESELNAMARRFAAQREALDESERRYRDLVDGSLQGVVINDGHRIVYGNDAAARILGFSDAADLCELDSVEAVIAPEERARLAGYRAARIRGEPAPESYAATWVRSDGERVAVENIVRSVVWLGAPAVQNTFVDVSERKRAQAELQNYRERLEELVAQRTAQLQEAQGELVRVERLSTIGQMTATVSHELRNPLGTLTASVSTLRAAIPAADERVTRILDRIERSVSRCNAIIQELMDFAQTRELAMIELPLDAWADRVIEDFQHAPAITVRWSAGAGDTRVRADPVRLEQCLVNVMSNGCQGMLDAGGAGEMLVRSEVLADRVELRVSDTGPGVPEELRERIFEPLFSTRGFGVGLGLPLVRRIMEQHHGGVEVRARGSTGACFVLWLPVQGAD